MTEHARPASLPIGYQFGDARCEPGQERRWCAECKAIVPFEYNIQTDTLVDRRGHKSDPAKP